VPTHLEGAEDGHEDGLGLGTFLAAIGVAVLQDQDGGADPPLPCFVVLRQLLMNGGVCQVAHICFVTP